MAQAKARRARALSVGLRRRLLYYFPTIAIAIAVIALWEIIVLIFNIQQFLLPRPSAIFAEFMLQVDLWLRPDERSILFDAGGATFWEAFGGFVIGCGGGILVALITSRWTIVSEATMPFAIAANSVPIIAFAPIMNNWFGITNPASKMAIASPPSACCHCGFARAMCPTSRPCSPASRSSSNGRCETVTPSLDVMSVAKLLRSMQSNN